MIRISQSFFFSWFGIPPVLCGNREQGLLREWFYKPTNDMAEPDFAAAAWDHFLLLDGPLDPHPRRIGPVRQQLWNGIVDVAVVAAKPTLSAMNDTGRGIWTRVFIRLAGCLDLCFWRALASWFSARLSAERRS
jgi:hypothetical protein